MKKFLRFMLPSVFAMVIFQLYSMIDGLFIANIVNETAISAVNLSLPYINSIFALAVMFAIGTATVIGIKQGQGKAREAQCVFTQNFVFLSIVGLGITLLAKIFLRPLALFLGASHATLPYVEEYLGTLVWFSYFYIVSYSLEVLVKTDGYPQLSALGNLLGALTNIGLDAFFMLALDLGLFGAALATGLSQVVAFLTFFLHFIRHKGSLVFVPFSFDFSLYKRIIPLGIPDFLVEASSGFIVFVFNHALLMTIGDEGIVSYTIITYVYNLIMMAFAGISQGTQPLISYNVGKQDWKQVQTMFRYALCSVFVLSLVAFLAILIFAPLIVSLFIDATNASLFADTVQAMRMFSLCTLVMGYNIVTSGYFTAKEKSPYAIMISLLRGFIVITLCIMLLALIQNGAYLWLATFMNETLCLFVTLALLKKDKA